MDLCLSMVCNLSQAYSQNPIHCLYANGKCEHLCYTVQQLFSPIYYVYLSMLSLLQEILIASQHAVAYNQIELLLLSVFILSFDVMKQLYMLVVV